MKLPSKFKNCIALVPGKNASVFSGVNKLLNRTVFLKVYSEPEGDHLSALREPQILQQLKHPNLVSIFSADKFTDDGKKLICLEMELISGGSLAERIEAARTDGKWPSLHEALRLTTQAAAGLAHLHENGFVHRDIKPANIMVANSSSPRAVVSDLGLASRLNAETQRSFASKHARIYRPPEVWAGLGYSVRSDVDQLGIVLYELCGGAFDIGALAALTDTDLEARVVDGSILDLQSLPAHVPAAVLDLIRRATAVDESTRFTTMSELCVALNNALNASNDWRLQIDSGGFLLERTDGDRILRVECSAQGKGAFKVQKRKQIGDGESRKAGKAERINHKNIARSQRMQAILRSTW